MSEVDGLACSHHIDDRIPYFKEHGVDVVMVTSIFARRTLNYPQSRVFPLHPGEIRNFIRTKLKGKIHNRILYIFCFAIFFLPLVPLYFVARIILPRHDNTIWWSIPAFIVGLRKCMSNKADILYSTGGSNSAHLAAAWISKCTKTPWVAEFQDPLIHGYFSKSRTEGRFIQWLEKMIMKRAKKVVFLTASARTIAERRTGQNGKGITIYAGGDPDLFDGPDLSSTEDGQLTISHMGSFIGSRNPRCFLLALNEAIERDQSITSDITFEVIGATTSEMEIYLNGFQHREMINILGKLPRASAITRMKSADVLLLIQNLENVSTETIPSKVYEYLLAQKPILGLVHHNPELTEMLQQRGHFVAEGDNVDAVKNRILEIHKQWKKGNLIDIIYWKPIFVQDAVKDLVVICRDLVHFTEGIP
jgi:hypothetical protein